MVRDFARQIERGDKAYKYDRCDFGLWVVSVKAPWSAMKAFREFEHCFAQLSDRDQRSVGADKFLLFLKSLNEKGRMAILSELEDDEGAYGLIEDWNEVERVCQRHKEMRSSTTRPASADERRMVRD